MIKMSQAFASFRSSLLARFQSQIAGELAHQFNAELEDIRRKDGEHQTYIGLLRTEGKEQAAVKLEDLANKEQKARLMDLQLRRQTFIDGLNKDMLAQINQRVADYGGETAEVQEPLAIEEGPEPKFKTVRKAQFPDGSMAKIPARLWVDYSLFQTL